MFHPKQVIFFLYIYQIQHDFYYILNIYYPSPAYPLISNTSPSSKNNLYSPFFNTNGSLPFHVYSIKQPLPSFVSPDIVPDPNKSPG